MHYLIVSNLPESIHRIERKRCTFWCTPTLTLTNIYINSHALNETATPGLRPECNLMVRAASYVLTYAFVSTNIRSRMRRTTSHLDQRHQDCNTRRRRTVSIIHHPWEQSTSYKHMFYIFVHYLTVGTWIDSSW